MRDAPTVSTGLDDIVIRDTLLVVARRLVDGENTFDHMTPAPTPKRAPAP